MSKSAIDLYLKQVKKELRCPTKQKNVLLSTLSQAMQDYAQENGTATMEKYMTVFGSPQAQAEELMETIDTTEIKKAFTWKRVVVVGVIAIVVIWLIAVVTMWIDGHKSANGYGKEYYVDENSNRIEITEVLQD